MAEAESYELLCAARNGDLQALDALMRRHLPALRAFVRAHADRILRDRESCSDLVQTACRQALEHLDEFQWRGEGSLKRWLFTLALNKIRNRRAHYLAARRDRRREVPIDRDATGGPVHASGFCYATLVTPSRTAAAVEEIERVERTLDRLPADQKNVIVWHRLVGLSHREIAEELGRTEESVRALLSRGMARFATYWEREGRSAGR